MENSMGYDNSQMKNVLLKTERLPCTPEAFDSLWVPNSSPLFHGSTSMVNFEDIRGSEKNSSEDFDECFHQPEKKRRLLPDQVQFLEKSFEVENKLEPERKVQLAKELGLQPRQVAIWFQNRRARYKTKHLEKEYDILKSSYDKLKADYDSLYKENERIKNEVQLLTEKLLGKPELDAPCDPTSPLDIHPKKPILSPNAASDVVPDAASSAKSDVVDSDSPHYTDGNHSAFLEPADSSHVFGPDHSDFSQDEDDNLSRSFLSTSCFPKLELECYDDLQPNSCNLGFPIQVHGTWFWPY